MNEKASNRVESIIMVGAYNKDSATVNNDEQRRAFKIRKLLTQEGLVFFSGFCGYQVSDIRITDILCGDDQNIAVKPSIWFDRLNDFRSPEDKLGTLNELPEGGFDLDRASVDSGYRPTKLDENLLSKLKERGIYGSDGHVRFAALSRGSYAQHDPTLDGKLANIGKEAADELKIIRNSADGNAWLVYADSLVLSMATRFFPCLDPVGQLIGPGDVFVWEYYPDKPGLEKDKWTFRFLHQESRAF